LMISSRVTSFRLFWTGRGGASRAAAATKLPLFAVALGELGKCINIYVIQGYVKIMAAEGGLAHVKRMHAWNNA
jgi:hypothetical protein